MTGLTGKSDWVGTTTMVTPIVSVLLITYNHSSFVGKALDGLFAQRFDGLIEVVVADDGSSDDTVSRIKSAARRFPSNGLHFRFLDSTNNHGITRNYERGFMACRGEYVAVLEGDDYWISPNKLQLQVAILRNNLECDLCSANYYVLLESEARFTLRVPSEEAPFRRVTARELIHDNIVGNFSTCMYRRSALSQLSPRIFSMRSYDWIVNISILRGSFLAFVNQPLSVYRLHNAGAWSGAQTLSKLKIQLSLIPAYDEFTDGVFNREFEELSVRLRQEIAVLETENSLSSDSNVVKRSAPFLVKLAMAPTLAWLRRSLPAKLKNKLKKIWRGAIA